MTLCKRLHGSISNILRRHEISELLPHCYDFRGTNLWTNRSIELPGAEKEGARVQELVAARPDIEAIVLARERASIRSEEASGVAEALMRGGIAIYMSTYWPVGDDAAKTFASTFYEKLLAGEVVGSLFYMVVGQLKDSATGQITYSTATRRSS